MLSSNRRKRRQADVAAAPRKKARRKRLNKPPPLPPKSNLSKSGGRAASKIAIVNAAADVPHRERHASVPLSKMWPRSRPAMARLRKRPMRAQRLRPTMLRRRASGIIIAAAIKIAANVTSGRKESARITAKASRASSASASRTSAAISNSISGANGSNVRPIRIRLLPSSPRSRRSWRPIPRSGVNMRA